MRTPSTTSLRATAAAQDRDTLDIESAVVRFLRTGARINADGNIVNAANEPLDLASVLESLPSRHKNATSKSKNKSAKDICPAEYTQPFMEFIDSSPTVFHAVSYFSKRLEGEGFVKLSERECWQSKLKKGGKYFTTRNGSSIVAFSIPTAYEPGNGVAMAAGHIDALTARLKPISKKPNSAGYVMLGVAPYAGGMNSTWWDRYVQYARRSLLWEESRY